MGKEVRCIADEIPFEIPDSWEWCNLQMVTTNIHYGYTASAATSGNSKLLRITDIQNNAVNWSDVPFCTVTPSELHGYQLHNRDIMIARTGGTIGKTYIVRNLNETAVFASYLIRAIPVTQINEEYLKIFMESPFYWTQLKDFSSGTGQPNVNGQSLKKLLLPLPSLAEQKRIVAKIEELLPHIEEYGKAESKVSKLNAEFPEQLKKSILQWAIQGKLVPQNPNDEPASVLLERIQVEKAKLIKEGKIKKDKNESIIFRRDNSHYEKLNGVERCIDDEIPFEIPKNWAWGRFYTVCINIVDCPHSTPKYLPHATDYWEIDTNFIDENGVIIKKRY